MTTTHADIAPLTEADIEAIIRKHVKADATGLVPAVISHHLFGHEDAAAEISSTIADLRAELAAAERLRDAARADADGLAGALQGLMRDLGLDEGDALGARAALAAHAAQSAGEPSVPVSKLTEFIERCRSDARACGDTAFGRVRAGYALSMADALTALLPSAPPREGGA